MLDTEKSAATSTGGKIDEGRTHATRAKGDGRDFGLGFRKLHEPPHDAQLGTSHGNPRQSILPEKIAEEVGSVEVDLHAKSEVEGN